MTNIPMSIEGLKEQYEQFRAIEDDQREDLNQLRRLVTLASKQRLDAYYAWQKALKDRVETKAK